jgi:hypothetical protein
MLQVLGDRTCANWQKDPQHYVWGGNWILGFWTGINFANERHDVGKTQDADGIIGEVKKICRDQPSMTLLKATVQVYSMIAGRERP